MYAIRYRGITGTLAAGPNSWLGRLCEIPYLAEYDGYSADDCIGNFHSTVDAWLAYVAECSPEPVPTEGSPEFPGPVEPEPIPE